MPPKTPTFLASLLAIALLTVGARAAVPVATDHVVLNEVLHDPDTGDEAVELLNPTLDPVDVDGWSLRDDETGCVDHPNATYPEHLQGTVPAGGTLVVELPNPVGGFSCLNLATDDVLLLDDEAGAAVDAVCWGSGCDAPEASNATEAPGDALDGRSIQRCFIVGPGPSVSHEDLGTVTYGTANATLDQPNAPCDG